MNAFMPQNGGLAVLSFLLYFNLKACLCQMVSLPAFCLLLSSECRKAFTSSSDITVYP